LLRPCHINNETFILALAASQYGPVWQPSPLLSFFFFFNLY